jgi:hypothetical protein
VDETHPLELYGEFEAPNRFGLVLFTHHAPPEPRSLRSLQIERGQRADRLYWLRLSVMGPALQAVFAGLCRDIVEFTRQGVNEESASLVILSRVERWRRLLEGELRGLSAEEVRGLIGELITFETDVMTACSALDAACAWTGPLGAAQDFRLPSGQRIEVKALHAGSVECRINGLRQLDSDSDPLVLAIVRLDSVGRDAEGATTAASLIARIRRALIHAPAAQNEFDSRLAAAGWYEHPSHEEIVVRVVRIDRYLVDDDFPRLTSATVPHGVIDAHYTIILPAREGSISGASRT